MPSEYAKRRLAEIRAENDTKPSANEDIAYAFRVVEDMRRAGEFNEEIERGITAFRVLPKLQGNLPPAPDAWTTPGIAVRTVAELLTLPKIDSAARRAGVYFLFHERELVYVGQSKNVRTRATNHDRYKSVIFDDATWLAIPWPWNIAVEAMYIAHHKPRWNSIYSESRCS